MGNISIDAFESTLFTSVGRSFAPGVNLKLTFKKNLHTVIRIKRIDSIMSV